MTVRRLHGHRHDLRTYALYVVALLREFRGTLWILAVAVAFGGALFAVTPHESLHGRRPDPLSALYAAWIALFGEAAFGPPERWYLTLVDGFYPLLGIVVVGEGVVRLANLLASRRHGEKEWMKVKASTYRDHVVLCGLGHVGFRVLQSLLARGEQVVAIESDPDGKFLALARATGSPILTRDARDDEALREAGVPGARVVIVATDDDVANLEVALDARRLNPRIRVVLRLFDQGIAEKVRAAGMADEAFSASALAAPTIASMALGGHVLASYESGGATWVTAEVAAPASGALTVAEVEARFGVRVLAVLGKGEPADLPSADASVAPGCTLVVHGRTDRVDAVRGSAG